MGMPNFEGWAVNQDAKVYVRRILGGRQIVGRLDGWNWGFITTDDNGEVISGKCNSEICLSDAISLAMQDEAKSSQSTKP
jgi:hypothetical protein